LLSAAAAALQVVTKGKAHPGATAMPVLGEGQGRLPLVEGEPEVGRAEVVVGGGKAAGGGGGGGGVVAEPAGVEGEGGEGGEGRGVLGKLRGLVSGS
jgi:hypothetical protein